MSSGHFMGLLRGFCHDIAASPAAFVHFSSQKNISSMSEYTQSVSSHSEWSLVVDFCQRKIRWRASKAGCECSGGPGKLFFPLKKIKNKTRLPPATTQAAWVFGSCYFWRKSEFWLDIFGCANLTSLICGISKTQLAMNNLIIYKGKPSVYIFLLSV